jgi:hypothetical protein
VSEALIALGALAFAALAWFGIGLMQAVRKVLSERVANWLLPPDQPSTFRFAQFIAFLAAGIAPRRFPAWNLSSPNWPGAWFLIFPATWTAYLWPEPESVLAELEADLRSERRVLDPVRVALPLLGMAVVLRLRYLRELAPCLAWIPLGVVLFAVMMPLVTFGDPIFAAIGFLRRGWRRAARRPKGRTRY